MAVLAIAWTAEALVRLPGGPVFTALIYGFYGLRFLGRTGLMLDLARRHWPMLAFPFLALISTAWSLVPHLSAVAGLQAVFTVLLGLYLGRVFGLVGLAGLLALALGASMMVSALNLFDLWSPAYSWEGGFMGVYTNKNGLGQRGVMFVLTALLFLATARRPVVWSMITLAALGLLALTLSVTAYLVITAILAAYALRALVLGGPGVRVLTVILAGTSLAAAAVVVWVLDLTPVAAFLDAFGKSATLTGRTQLWQIAWDVARDYPLLGTGYMAYWAAPEYAQEARAIAGLYGATVASFHNFILEALVMLGPLGVAAMALFLGHLAFNLGRLPSGPLAFWAGTMALTLVALALLGSALYRPHEISLLLCAALAAAAARPSGGLPDPQDVPASEATRRPEPG